MSYVLPAPKIEIANINKDINKKMNKFIGKSFGMKDKEFKQKNED